VPGVTSFVILGGAIAAGMIGARSAKRRRTAILQAVAKRRNGRLDVGGWFGNPLLELVHADDIEIDVSMFSTRSAELTEVRMQVPEPGLPAFSIAQHGITSALGLAHRVTIGERLFDATFSIKATDIALVRRMWPRERAQRMYAVAPKGTLECKGIDVKLIVPVIDTIEQVEGAVELLLELARCDPYGITALAQLPGATMVEDDGFTRAELPGPSRVLIGPFVEGGIARTCARVPATGDLAEDVEPRIVALGATLQQTHTEVRIWWAGIETESKRLLGAYEVLRAVAAGPSLGVFR
jgi:hypothetical protein